MLLTIGCQSYGAKKEDKRADPIVAVSDEKGDHKADEKKAEDTKEDAGGYGGGDDGTEISTSGFPAAADDGGEGETGEEPHGHKESLDGPSSKRRPDGCKKGAMKFEGKCLNKDRVEKILEKRDEEVKRKVHEAKNAQQQADAAHDLLEQQIAQIDKTEDDLDEIIQQLQEENAKKYGDPPDKNEDKP